MSTRRQQMSKKSFGAKLRTELEQEVIFESFELAIVSHIQINYLCDTHMENVHKGRRTWRPFKHVYCCPCHLKKKFPSLFHEFNSI